MFPNLTMIAVCALVALAIQAYFTFRDKVSARREIVGEGAQKIAAIGMVKGASVATAYSEGRYAEFFHSLKAFFKSLTTDPNFLLSETKGLVAHLATTPDGLKMLQDAVASAKTA